MSEKPQQTFDTVYQHKSIGISRRKLLLLGSSSIAGGVLFQSSYARATSIELLGKWIQELPRFPVLKGNQTLAIAQGLHQFHPWLPPTTTWGFGGAGYSGPSIEAIAGIPQQLTFNNQLTTHILAHNLIQGAHGTRLTDASKPRTSIHLHGGITNAQNDGNPEDEFFPQQYRTYTYTNKQEACHIWYHDHALGITRLNVFAGLAGQYFIRDEWDTGTKNPLGLPYGSEEITLVLQDKAISNSGQLQYRPLYEKQDSWTPGFFGSLSLVNGVAFPKLTVARGVYRFRIINAANTRYYTLSLSNKAPIYVIGNDQGLLNAPVQTNVLSISPGERYDILLDFSSVPANTIITLYNTAIPPNTGVLGGTFLEVMRFVVNGNSGSIHSIPKTLRGGNNQRALLPVISTLKVTRVRNVTLIMDIAKECHGPMPFIMRLNNMTYAQGEPEAIPAGVWEQWNIVNLTNESHPFHIHLAEMRILGRQSINIATYILANPRPKLGVYWAPSPNAHTINALIPPALWEQGRKDTVDIPAFGVTRILVRIPTSAEVGLNLTANFRNSEGKVLSGYMYHCHMLEHEDCDMMRPFIVTE